MTNAHLSLVSALGLGSAGAYGHFRFLANMPIWAAAQSITEWSLCCPQNKHNKFAIKRLNCANGLPMR